MLLSTGSSYILNFDKFQKEDESSLSSWGGKIINGQVFGHNRMGALLMHLRECFGDVYKCGI